MKRIFSAVWNYIKHTDRWLLLLSAAASGLSVLLLWSLVHSGLRPSDRDWQVQAAAAGLGLCAAVIISKFDYHFLARLWKLHLPVAYGLFFLTFLFGQQRGEADDKAWLPLPFGFQFQPTELLKYSFILTFALHLQRVGEHVNELRTLLLLCLHGAIPVLLIHLQGDDGMALIFALIFLSMLFSAGIRWSYVGLAVCGTAVTLPLAWNFLLSNDQRKRFLAILQPGGDLLGSEWQQYRGRLSIGAGQVWGTGLLTGEHYSVPEIHNDFIFSFIGQALGFVGTIGVMALLAAICLKILHTGCIASDPLGRYICVGVFATIAFQTVINIGMCLSLLPVAGLTLPFFSAGGTSTTTLYIGIGLVLSVYTDSKVKMLFD